VLQYLANNEGRAALEAGLAKKLKQFSVGLPAQLVPRKSEQDDDLPF
jgi:hypothetical protein